MVISALAEVASIGSVIPVVAALTSSEELFSQEIAVEIFEFAGATDPSAKKFLLVSVAIFIVLLAGSLRATLSFVGYKFAYGVSAEMAAKIFGLELRRPFTRHIQSNSSEVLGSVNKSSIAVGNVVLPVIKAVAAAITAGLILAAMVVVQPLLLICAVGLIAFLYFLAGRATIPKLEKVGKYISSSQASRIKVMQEGLGGIRDVILTDTHKLHIDQFRDIETRLRQSQATNYFLAELPKYLVEVFAVCAILASVLLLERSQENFISLLPLLAAFAFALQKLMPLAQQIYSTWSIAAGYRRVVEDLLNIFEGSREFEKESKAAGQSQPLTFERLRLRDVSFRYSEQSQTAIDQMTLSIARGSVIGLYGETGSGKSTLIDLIMGFLSPSRGQISLDEEPLAGEVLRGWQSNLSLVPQTIYLADTTIIRNVAFGVDPNHIDLLKVRKCIAAAQLNSFIEGLPDGLDTFVGERGVQMSGGQRQRLGIARALYRDPKVLILDEATSALDPETESAIVKNIDSVSRGMTMIIIAHRFQTLIGCDVILKIANGKIERRGTYQDIFGESL